MQQTVIGATLTWLDEGAVPPRRPVWIDVFDTPIPSSSTRRWFDRDPRPTCLSFRVFCAPCTLCSQIGGSEHAAEIHWVHLKEGTTDELLVVGVMFDTSEYGSNVEVRNESWKSVVEEPCVFSSPGKGGI